MIDRKSGAAYEKLGKYDGTFNLSLYGPFNNEPV